jgi:hypothetical protein
MSDKPVWPGIAEFKAEAPMPGHGPLWQINGLMEQGSPDDDEAWGWIAEVTPAWDDDGTDGGDLARFLVRSAAAHSPLVEALARFLRPDGHAPSCGFYTGSTHACIPQCADARAALALARGEATS